MDASEPLNAATVATIVAAVATTVSALVIAIQAWYTRKSVAASVEATRIAESALRESQIARIEAAVPRLSLRVGRSVDVAKLYIADHWPPQRVPVNATFVLPRDAERNLQVRHTVTVTNDGPATASITPRAVFGGYLMELATPIRPGESGDFELMITRPVSEWIDLARQTRDTPISRGPEAARFTFTYEGPRDSDVTEVHEVVIRGSVLTEVEDANGTWRPFYDDGFAALMPIDVLPATRTYWRSRAAREELRG